MPVNNFHETAFETVNKVLCDGAFIFIDVLEDEAIPDEGGWSPVCTVISFSGHRRGSMSLWCEEPFLHLAAANLLGQDENSPDAKQKGWDAIKEILNMIAGNLLSDIFGSQPVFDLGLPAVVDQQEAEEQLVNVEKLWVEAEGHPVLFTFSVDQ
ncbi:MAG: chemotaxis protein CheX [Chitinivibrionales bacterium]